MILSKEDDPRSHCSLTEVNYSKDCNYNLLSLTYMLREGWSIYGDAKAIKIKKGGKTLVFDVRINTARGALYFMTLQRPQTDVAAAVVDDNRRTGPQKPISADTAHQLLGNMSPDATRAAAGRLGWINSPGKQEVCKACALAKARQKNADKKVDRQKNDICALLRSQSDQDAKGQRHQLVASQLALDNG